MPGVPSGRGCEACRKAKKKCDLTTPSCSRCSRLNVDCVGAGIKRFVFINRGASSSSSSSAASKSLSPSHSPVLKLSRTPSNETLHLVSELVKAISPTTDFRYNLAWSYGIFLGDIPRRLGKSAALDASTAALVQSHSSYCIHGKPDIQTLAKYSTALKELRISLSHSFTARSSETLAAIMILMTCQSFVGGQGDNWTTHGEGAAEILKARRYYDRKDSFETKLLMSLRGPVLIEAIFNPRIVFSASEWKILVENHLDEDTPEGVMMCSVARIPDFMRRARAMVAGISEDADLIDDIRLERQKLLDVTSDLSQNAKKVEGALRALKVEDYFLNPALFRYERSHGLSLTFLVIMTLVLGGVDVVPSYQEELDTYADLLVSIAMNSVVYRPIGAQFAAFCLISAWIATSSPEFRDEILSLICEFGLDYSRAHQLGKLVPGLEKASQHLRLLDV